MWQQIAAWLRLLWNMGNNVQLLRADVKDLQMGEQDTHDFMTALATKSELQRKDNELLRKDNEMLRRDLEIEREKRVDELEKIELRLRLQISEELRRLPSDGHDGIRD